MASAMNTTDRPRVVVTKIGFDGHDRGSRLVARYLRDAGMEVLYTAPWQTIEGVVSLAVEEDVDLIGISSLAADHLIVPALMDALREADLGHIPVVLGGIIPTQEVAMMHDAGIAAIFHPGATRQEIVSTIERLVRQEVGGP
jgi:methylmalonyl-CoA mutase C-terminal domain/subunit